MPDHMGRQVGSAFRTPESPNAPKAKTQKGARGSRRAGSRPDGITNPEAQGDAVYGAIYGALRPLDERGIEMESKWGKDRLISLVTPETASLYWMVFERLNGAIDRADVDVIKRDAAVLWRGLEKLDIEATRLGAEPMPSNVWTYTSDSGVAYWITLTDDDRAAVIEHVEKKDTHRVQSIETLLRVFELDRVALVKEVFEHFPKAKITKANGKEVTPEDGLALFDTPRAQGLEDDIPF